MGEILSVGMGEIKTGGDGDTLAAYGIGSCVVVVCYDRALPVAGMLHGILPEKPGKKTEPGRYIDTGISLLIKALLDRGAGINGLEAKIFGGASMFDVKAEGHSIGERNIKKAREVLSQKGIFLAGEDTGSTYGRNIEFVVSEKKAVVKSYMSGTKII